MASTRFGGRGGAANETLGFLEMLSQASKYSGFNLIHITR